MIFFTADTHFGHAGALGLYRRPFDSVPAMDAAMEQAWNATVAVDDEVWHLGDVAVGPRNPAKAVVFADSLDARLARLHGRKHLVTGNNDPERVRSWQGWASVQALQEVCVGGTTLVLCHYALRSWNGMGRGALNLHGHSHGALQPLPRQFDVGVDVRGFRPVTLDELRGSTPGRSKPRRDANQGARS